MNYADRVKDTSASVGTGPITLFGAPITGFRTFLSAFPSGAVDVPYAIDDGAGNWEIGIGSFADSVLTRTQVLSSSSNGGLVDFVAGKKSVICTLPADLVESATNRSIAAASESAGHAVQTAQDKAQTGLDRAAAEQAAADAAGHATNAAQSAALLGSAAIVTATGTVALTDTSAVYQLIDPNGAERDVVLPTLAAGDAGRSIVVNNAGSAYALTVKSGATQIGPSLTPRYSLSVLWTGSEWVAL